MTPWIYFKNYCGSLDFFKGEFNDSEFLHFTLDLISEHFVKESVGQENLLPLLFTQVLVQHGSLSDFLNLDTSDLIGLKDWSFAHKEGFNILKMTVPLFFFGLKLFEEFFINFGGSVFTLTEFGALLEENF